MDIYRQFLESDWVSIPEEQDARNIVINKLNIYNARRKWYNRP